MRRSIPIVASLILIASACTPATPAGLTDADKAAIEAHEQSFGKMAVAGDMAALTKAYYSDDAMFLAPNEPGATGSAAIVAALKGFPPITAMALHTDEVGGSGNTAWVRGKYTMVMAPPGAGTVADTGKFIEIEVKQADGSWRTTRDMFSSDLPAAPAPAPPPKKAAKK